VSHVFGRDTRTQFPVAVRGEGIWLYDSTGKRYLDASGGAAVSCLGHDHPAVREAAVIGVAHPKWQERPLAVVVVKDGAQVAPADLREFLSLKFAKWQLPDAFVFTGELPRTSVGKLLKLKLREQYANWEWET